MNGGHNDSNDASRLQFEPPVEDLQRLVRHIERQELDADDWSVLNAVLLDALAELEAQQDDHKKRGNPARHLSHSSSG